jgi:hypothetical protein
MIRVFYKGAEFKFKDDEIDITTHNGERFLTMELSEYMDEKIKEKENE